MLLLVRTVVRAPDVGWASARRSSRSSWPLALLCAFVAIEQRTRHPLVRLGHPALRLARAGQPRRDGDVRRLRRRSSSSRRCSCRPSWAGRRCTPRWRSCRPACWSPSARRASARWSTASAPQRLIAVGFVVVRRRLRAVPARQPLARPTCTMILPTILLLGIGFALGVPVAEHAGDRRRGRPRAGPGLGPGQHLVPGRRRDRPGDRQRDRRQRRGTTRLPGRDPAARSAVRRRRSRALGARWPRCQRPRSAGREAVAPPPRRSRGAMAERRIAIADLGSNTFRLVVFTTGEGWWRRTDEIYEGVRIGDGLAATGELGDEPMRPRAGRRGRVRALLPGDRDRRGRGRRHQRDPRRDQPRRLHLARGAAGPRALRGGGGALRLPRRGELDDAGRRLRARPRRRLDAARRASSAGWRARSGPGSSARCG